MSGALLATTLVEAFFAGMYGNKRNWEKLLQGKIRETKNSTKKKQN